MHAIFRVTVFVCCGRSNSNTEKQMFWKKGKFIW